MSINYQRMYDRMAGCYAAVVTRIPVWRRYTEAALPWLPDSGVILEIGPGPGVLHTTLAARYPQVLALDLSHNMLHHTAHRLQRAGLTSLLLQGNVVNLPLMPTCVDAVVLTFMLSAVPDAEGALRELTRVLHPGGVIVVVDACRPSDGNQLGRALAWLWARFGDFMRDEAALMRSAGLDVIECREFGAFHGIRLTVGCKPS